MFRDGDTGSYFRRSGHLGDVGPAASGVYARGQIEVAIIKVTVPGDGNKAAAHEPVHRAWIKALDQLLHITFQIAGLLKPGAKSA